MLTPIPEPAGYWPGNVAREHRSRSASFQAFNDRDVDAMLENWSDEVEMRLIGGFADLMGVEFRGHEGVRRWFGDWVGSLGVRAEIEAIFDGDDQVVVIARAVGAGGASGAPVALRGGQIYHFREGLITGVDNYYFADEALEAAGLPQQDAHPDS